MAKNITIRQAEVVAAIRNFQHQHGYQPSIRELSRLLDLARGTIVGHMKALAKKNIIVRHPRIARSIEIVPIYEQPQLFA